MKLRPYQTKAMEAVISEWEKGNNKTLLTLPTGCGKTVIFAKVIEHEIENGSKALVLAHRGELLTQASDKIKAVCGIDSAVEKAESSSLGSMFPVTVASVQSMSQDLRLSKFPEDYFGTIVVDEAHHCLSPTYQKVLSHFPSAHILGVTATPDRGDMKDLGTFFDSLAYEYSMSRAIREKYLSPIRAQLIPLEVDIGNVRISSGDYSAGDIGDALEPYLEQIAEEMKTYCKGRKTVVFLPLVKTSKEFCALLNEKGIKALEVDGNSDDRDQVLSDFTEGRADVLCNAMLLTEGWDCPSVDCIIVLRPTKIRSLYQQMVGRGMRLSPGKEDLLLLDFLWMTERHDLLKPSALVSKDTDIAGRIDRKMEGDADGVDLLEAGEESERDAVRDREASLARELAEMRQRQRKLVDPLQYALSIASEDLVNYTPTFAWEMGPPTKKQLDMLEKRGIFSGSIQNQGMASLIIDRLIRRQEEGLSTPKQIRCLEKYGFSHVGTWTFENASEMISRLAANGWSIPLGMTPMTYVP